MRLVVDTNVFVSAALKQASAPGHVLRWVAAYGGLLKSQATAHELLAVLARPRIARRIAPDFLAGVRLLLADAENVAIIEALRVCRDAEGDKFVELAVNGGADVMVSGDGDHRALRYPPEPYESHLPLVPEAHLP